MGGRYVLKSPVARGTLGPVYRAIQRELGYEVALKLMRPDLTPTEADQARLLQELRVASSFTHQHVIQLRDFGRDAELGSIYLVTDLVYGPSAVQVLEAEGALAPERAVRLACQVLDALDAAHRQGLVHGRVRPNNVLLATGSQADEEVRLLDFWFARSQTAPGSSIGTSTGELDVSALAYMSPEQAEGLRLDARSDVYSAAAVLYEWLSGSPPIEVRPDAANFRQALLAALLVKPPRPLSEALPAAPPALSAALDRGLAKRREERFASADELRRELMAAMSRGSRPRRNATGETPVVSVPAVDEPRKPAWLATLHEESAEELPELPDEGPATGPRVCSTCGREYGAEFEFCVMDATPLASPGGKPPLRARAVDPGAEPGPTPVRAQVGTGQPQRPAGRGSGAHRAATPSAPAGGSGVHRVAPAQAQLAGLRQVGSPTPVGPAAPAPSTPVPVGATPTPAEHPATEQAAAEKAERPAAEPPAETQPAAEQPAVSATPQAVAMRCPACMTRYAAGTTHCMIDGSALAAITGVDLQPVAVVAPGPVPVTSAPSAAPEPPGAASAPTGELSGKPAGAQPSSRPALSGGDHPALQTAGPPPALAARPTPEPPPRPTATPLPAPKNTRKLKVGGVAASSAPRKGLFGLPALLATLVVVGAVLVRLIQTEGPGGLSAAIPTAIERSQLFILSWPAQFAFFLVLRLAFRLLRRLGQRKIAGQAAPGAAPASSLERLKKRARS